MNKKSNTSIHQEGVDAFAQGFSIHACPYHAEEGEEKERDLWTTGWTCIAHREKAYPPHLSPFDGDD